MSASRISTNADETVRLEDSVVRQIRAPRPIMRKRRAKPAQASFEFDRDFGEASGYQYFLVGGWPEFSAYIDPKSVPLCTHDHAPVSDELARRLVKKCLVPGYFKRRCLLAPWREYAAGTTALTYGTVGAATKFDLFLEDSESREI